MRLIAELFRGLLLRLAQVIITECNGYSTIGDSAAETVNRAVVNRPTADVAYGLRLQALPL